METCSHKDLFPFVGSESIISSHIVDSMGQLAMLGLQRNQLWIVGEQDDASTYNFYYIESFMEYLLESSDVREDSYKVFEVTLI